MEMEMEMEGEMKNLSRVCIVIIVSLCYCNLVSGRLPKGKWRFISLLPIFYIFTIIPLSLKFAYLTEMVVFCITWLSNFKLLLFAFDQGPLSSKSLPIFIAMAALPFNLKPKTEAKTPKKIPLNLATETLIFAVLISMLYNHKEYIHPYVLNVVYTGLIFLAAQIVIGLSNLLVYVLSGVEMEPPSDEPYLSTSIQEFWGRRWNLMVNSILRETIYKPVRSAAARAALGRDSAALLGVLAVFTISGLMHELTVWYVTRVSPTWEMTMFFVVHGVCVAMEFGLKKKMKKWGLALPWYVSWPLTAGFMMATTYWLFFPPLTRNAVDVRVFQELRLTSIWAKHLLNHIFNFL